MNDCPNADIRDCLPDLLHGRLGAERRAQVESHLAACADCAAELAMLRAMKAVMHSAPSVDASRIGAAIPPYHVATRRWSAVKIAAAAVVLLGGASTLVVMQRDEHQLPPQTVAVIKPVPAPDTLIAPPVPQPAASVSPSRKSEEAREPQVHLKAHVPSGAVRELALGGASLGDLNDRELSALLKAVDALDAVPTTDVESGSLAPTTPRRIME